MSAGDEVERLRAEVASLSAELRQTQELLARASDDMEDDEITKSLCALSVRVLVKRGVGPWIDGLGWALASACAHHGVGAAEMTRASEAKYASLTKGRPRQ